MKKILLILLVSLGIAMQAQPVSMKHGYNDTSSKALHEPVFSLNVNELKPMRNQVDYQWISYKAKIDLQGNGINNNCQAFFVNRIDSIIYLNLHVSGVEIIRVVLTPAEVIMVNKLDQTFFQGDYERCTQVLGFQFDFDFVQSIFNETDFHQFEDNLQSLELEESVHSFVTPRRQHHVKDWAIMQRIDRELTTGNLRNEITDLVSGKILTISYEANNDSVALYNRMKVLLPVRNLEITVTPKGTKYNVPGPTSIKIPEKFTPITF